MNRIDKTFKQAKQNKKTLFIAYIMAGDPTLKETETLVPALENAGVDLIELGIPFSDPIADGVVNQEAAMRALSSGTTLKGVLQTVSQIRQTSQIPIVLFSYLNPITQFGIEEFAQQASKVGIDGVLALDLPPEESKPYVQSFKKAGLKSIFLISPTTDVERIKKINKMANGFLYYVSRLGVTGIQENLGFGLENRLKEIKQNSSLPIAVGFGISKPEHVKELSSLCDAVVVGSAIVKKVEENIGNSSLIENVTQFVKSLTSELNNE